MSSNEAAAAAAEAGETGGEPRAAVETGLAAAVQLSGAAAGVLGAVRSLSAAVAAAECRGAAAFTAADREQRRQCQKQQQHAHRQS